MEVRPSIGALKALLRRGAALPLQRAVRVLAARKHAGRGLHGGRRGWRCFGTSVLLRHAGAVKPGRSRWGRGGAGQEGRTEGQEGRGMGQQRVGTQRRQPSGNAWRALSCHARQHRPSQGAPHLAAGRQAAPLAAQVALQPGRRRRHNSHIPGFLHLRRIHSSMCRTFLAAPRRLRLPLQAAAAADGEAEPLGSWGLAMGSRPLLV